MARRRVRWLLGIVAPALLLSTLRDASAAPTIFSPPFVSTERQAYFDAYIYAKAQWHPDLVHEYNFFSTEAPLNGLLNNLTNLHPNEWNHYWTTGRVRSAVAYDPRPGLQGEARALWTSMMAADNAILASSGGTPYADMQDWLGRKYHVPADLLPGEVHEALNSFNLRRGYITWQPGTFSPAGHGDPMFVHSHAHGAQGTSMYLATLLAEFGFFYEAFLDPHGENWRTLSDADRAVVSEHFRNWIRASYVDLFAKALLPTPLKRAFTSRLRPIPTAIRNNSPVGYRCHMCFVAGTPVWTELGKRPIETIKPGELVWALDTDTGNMLLVPVVETVRRSDQPVTRVRLVSDSGEGETVQSSLTHPFFVEGKGWTKTADLQERDRVFSPEGDLAVTEVEKTSRHETVYNLSVPGAHTFFVGDIPVLVHNCFNLKQTGFERWGFRGGIERAGSAALFALPFVTDALRSDSLGDFSNRALNSTWSMIKFAPVALLVHAACPLCGVAMDTVLAGIMIYDFVATLQERLEGRQPTEGQFFNDLSWWLVGMFDADTFAAPIASSDQNLYYD